LIKKSLLALYLTMIIFSLNAQTHISVPLGHPVYIVLEQAQMRGLCSALPLVKPYSRETVLSLINEILYNDNERRFGSLIKKEREILEQFRQDLNPQRSGFDLSRGTVSIEQTDSSVYLSGEFGFGLDTILAAGYYPAAGGYSFNDVNHPKAGDFFSDYTILPYISFFGDLGSGVSYGLTLYGTIAESPRSILGYYQKDFSLAFDDPDNIRTVFSEPLAYFPYTYKKRWDGFLFAPGGLSSSGQLSWPRDISLGYQMLPELSASLLDDHVFLRFARIDREWAGMTANGSLVLNQSAQPFLAFETVIQPFSWISFSALAGVLEYDTQWGSGNKAELVETSQTFQNAFSIVMLEAAYKNYFNVTLGSSVVWSKRFELGYLFPLMENFFYQNNIGDFDNLALFLNLQGQYPGIGRFWFSFFLDEVNIAESNLFFELDRMMYAFQAGGSAYIPFLPFSSITLSYTKIEPYNYSHIRGHTPWHKYKMETNYVNAGRPLGYYLPPNSDELLIRFETMPAMQLTLGFQYQMIRHGADYGDRAVDGSSLWSEMGGNRGGNGDPELRKFFLKDGAYQWMHVFKLRGEYSFKEFSLPFKTFVEVGGVYSYFTDISGNPNSGKPSQYRIINTPEYPHVLRFIGMIGIQIFPKF